MSAINPKIGTATYLSSMGQRVRTKINSNNSLVFVDPDMTFFIYNQSATNMAINISTPSSGDIINYVATSSSANIFQTGANTISRNLNGSIVNQFTNLYTWNDTNLITEINFSSTNCQITNMVFKNLMVNLKKLQNTVLTNGLFLGDFNFLSKTPNLDILKAVVSTNATNSTALLNSSIKYLMILGAMNVAITSNLPTNLRYLHFMYSGGHIIDLKNYFNGVRCGLYFQLQNFNNLGDKLHYTGGALFPSVISEEAGMPVDYILYQGNGVGTKLTSDMFSQFIIDFANQVTAVNLVNKRIFVSGTTPNTSYTDNSKPIYKTYNDAFNFITKTVVSGGLGVTITSA